MIGALLVLGVLVGAWELYADFSGVDNLILPAPHAVASSLWNDHGMLLSNLGTTAEEVLLGIVLALIVGVALAIAVHVSPVLRRALYPLAVGSQAIPIAVLSPLLVFWWGFGIAPKLAIVVLVCFFPVAVTTIDALARVDPMQLALLRTLGASRAQVFRFAEAPAALPAALSGARISLAVAVIGAVFGEYSGSSSGLGELIRVSLPQFETARAWAAAVLLAAFAVACFSSLSLIERQLTPWTRPQAGGSEP